MIYIVGAVAVILGVILDQFTKYLASVKLIDNPVILIDGVFELRYLENRGAAFGLLQNQQVFFIVVGIIALILLSILYIRLPKTKRFIPLRICIISIATGAIGNLIDRIRFQYVIDFLYFELIDFPIFNVADIFASVATFVLIFLILFYYKEQDFELIFQLFKKKEA